MEIVSGSEALAAGQRINEIGEQSDEGGRCKHIVETQGAMLLKLIAELREAIKDAEE